MAWFWGSSTKDPDEEDEEEDSSEEEEEESGSEEDEYETDSENDDDEEEDDMEEVDVDGSPTREDFEAIKTRLLNEKDPQHQIDTVTPDKENHPQSVPPPQTTADAKETTETNTSATTKEIPQQNVNPNEAADATTAAGEDHDSLEALADGPPTRHIHSQNNDHQPQPQPHDSDEEEGELVLQGAIPGQVVGHRERAPSALSHDEVSHATSNNTSSYEDGESAELSMDDDEEEEEEDDDTKATTTSWHDQWNLLILAAEHDRVDILHTLLGDVDAATKASLLHDGLPPLHVAILYGSMNAMNSLLRTGADPSVRPDLSTVPPEMIKAVPQAKLLDGSTAWELAFGSTERIVKTVDLPLSKQEGIRHAFCAEALRCIGSDEVERLQQLLKAGVPPALDMGGKTLYDWAVEMSAPHCEELLRPAEAARFDHANNGKKEDNDNNSNNSNDNSNNSEPMEKKENGEASSSHHSAVLDRPSHNGEQQESIDSLLNRLDELESLATALSTCLDNLAEEVSVCHGLLLMGGGASALAAHVRSLKANKEAKMEEIQRMSEAWENSEDELAYWLREAGPQGREIAAQITSAPSEFKSRHSFAETTDESQRRTQLQAQIAAIENKIRKLRVSIMDLGEENTRDLAEVERRGLSGGIQLVRNLREEIRDLEFQLTEIKSGEAACRAKISLLQTKVKEQGDSQPPSTTQSYSNNDTSSETDLVQDGSEHKEQGNGHAPSMESKTRSFVVPEPEHSANNGSTSRGIVLPTEEEEQEEEESGSTKESERIARGESTAIALSHKGGRGYFPTSLWQILLRIIGIGDNGPVPSTTRERSRQPAVIV